jgi:tetratricopeptide (TPR) repeat protein
MLRGVGRFDEAEKLYQSALEIQRAALGDKHPSVAMTLTSLGSLRLQRDDPAGALPYLTDALATYLAAKGSTRTSVAGCRGELGECLTKLARFAEAEPLLVDSQQEIEAARQTNAGDKRKSVQRLVNLYTAWNGAEPSDERARKRATWQAKLDAQPAAEETR